MAVQDHQHAGPSHAEAFTALLFKWKGSLYKLVYKELLIFLIGFAFLSAINQFALNDEQKAIFVQIVDYFKGYSKKISLPFILGFYVTMIATRWWSQFMALPWPDRLLLCVTLYLPGNDDESRSIRRNLLRYATLMLVLVLQHISESVKSKYPGLDDLVKAGIMTQQEMDLHRSIKTDVNLYWVPGTWFVHLLRQCGLQGRIDSEGTKLVMEQVISKLWLKLKELLNFRARCSVLWNHNWVSIPLVYTQVVTLATYTFFTASMFGRQYVPEKKGEHAVLPVDIFVPLWAVLEFLFYMGLLKVAEQLINPYGEDDEDFELNFLIERHMKVIHLGAEVLADTHPPIRRVWQQYTTGTSDGAQQPKTSVQATSTLQ